MRCGKSRGTHYFPLAGLKYVVMPGNGNGMKGEGERKLKHFVRCVYTAEMRTLDETGNDETSLVRTRLRISGRAR